MNKLKIFFRIFVKSISRPKYYKDVLKAKFSFSLKYLALLLLIVNLITAVKLGSLLYKYYPKAAPFIAEVKQMVVDFYPQELVLTIKKQKITTNVKEPYYINFPEQLEKITAGYYKHLITIDTKGKADDYKNYESLVLITADKVVSPDDKGKGDYRVTLLSDKLIDVPDGTKVNKALYDQGVKKILPYLDNIAKYFYGAAVVGILLMPLAGTLFGLIGNAFYLFWASALLWVVVKVMKKKLDYGKIYRLGMHGLTLPIVVNLGTSLLGFHFPLLFSLIFLVWMLIVLVRIKA